MLTPVIGGVATRMSTFGGARSNFFLDDVNCTGNESNIFDCQYPLSTNCITGLEEAGVICRVTPGNDDYSETSEQRTHRGAGLWSVVERLSHLGGWLASHTPQSRSL